MTKNTQVECLLNHPPEGKKIELFGRLYHFKPQPEDGALVAEVEDDKHRAAFLRVREGYREYQPNTPRVTAPRHADPALTATLGGNSALSAPEAPRLDADTATAGLMGSNRQPGTLTDANGREYLLSEVVQLAYERSGFPQAGWNKMGEDEREARIQDVVDELKLDDASKPKTEATQEKNARDLAAARFNELAGRAPHHKWSVDRIQDEIKAIEAANAAEQAKGQAGEQAE